VSTGGDRKMAGLVDDASGAPESTAGETGSGTGWLSLIDVPVVIDRGGDGAVTGDDDAAADVRVSGFRIADWPGDCVGAIGLLPANRVPLVAPARLSAAVGRLSTDTGVLPLDRAAGGDDGIGRIGSGRSILGRASDAGVASARPEVGISCLATIPTLEGSDPLVGTAGLSDDSLAAVSSCCAGRVKYN
jgi:hypothetical protein